MTVNVCKGTLLQHDIASTMTTITQVISLEGLGGEGEVFESDYLNKTGSGIPMTATGRSEARQVNGEMFWDPVNTGHQLMTDDITTPANRDYNVQLADSAQTDWPFTVASVGVGLAVALNDGLKASFTLTPADLPTFPT